MKFTRITELIQNANDILKSTVDNDEKVDIDSGPPGGGGDCGKICMSQKTTKLVKEVGHTTLSSVLKVGLGTYLSIRQLVPPLHPPPQKIVSRTYEKARGKLRKVQCIIMFWQNKLTRPVHQTGALGKFIHPAFLVLSGFVLTVNTIVGGALVVLSALVNGVLLAIAGGIAYLGHLASEKERQMTMGGPQGPTTKGVAQMLEALGRAVG